MEEEILDPETQAISGRGDTKEGYYIGREIEKDSEEALKPLHGPNQWPSEDLLPGWRETMMNYHSLMTSKKKNSVKCWNSKEGKGERGVIYKCPFFFLVYFFFTF